MYPPNDIRNGKRRIKITDESAATVGGTPTVLHSWYNKQSAIQADKRSST
jgi:hypothetical protein